MNEENSLESFLTQEKPCKALLRLRHSDEIFISELARDIETTHAHSVNIVNILKSMGLVSAEKSGRKKMLELTEEGERVAEAVKNLTDVIDEVVQPEKEGMQE